MSFRSRFNQFFNRGGREIVATEADIDTNAAADAESSTFDAEPGAEALDANMREFTYDDLAASVPFAGDADEMSTPEVLSASFSDENLAGGGVYQQLRLNLV